MTEALALQSPSPAWARGGAEISSCGRYRYHLWRQVTEVEQLRRVLFVMLNPSTADGVNDDPTIRKCRGFAERWGFQRFDVANLFAWRETVPRELAQAQRRGEDIKGPENERRLMRLATTAAVVVLAWGADAERWRSYARAVAAWVARATPAEQVFCLGQTACGQPRHPGRIGYDTPLVDCNLRRIGP